MLTVFFLFILPVSGFLGTLIGYVIVDFSGMKTHDWFTLIIFGLYMVISLGYLYKLRRQTKKKWIHYR